MIRSSSSSPSSVSFYNNQPTTQIAAVNEEGQFSLSLHPIQLGSNKIESVTAGLQGHYVSLLKKQSSENAETIADYVLAMNIEVNPSIAHRSNQIRTLSYLSEFHKQKPFSKITRNDIIQYLESLRRPEESDPLHKWIGTYNLRRVYLMRFFNMTIAYRLFSYLSLLPIINLDSRPRILFRKKGEPIAQVMPFATYDDLKESLFLMEYADGVRPYILEWYEKVFLNRFKEKTEPDSKLFKKDDLRTEDRIALTTQELVDATKQVQDKTLTVKKILQTYLDPLMNEGYIDKQESNINHRNNIYYPLVLESDNSYSLFQIFSGQKRNMEQENISQDFTNFTRELSPEYIKGKIDKVVSCSSGPDLFCEIFDCEHKKITVDELVERHYYISIKNAESGTFSEEQGKEQESSSVGQMQSISVHSDQQIEKKEQGISNIDLEDYSCYYCDYRIDNRYDYEQHVIIKHPGRIAYPNKAEIEKRGLKPQGKDWEI